jgi:hypothetical protein
VKNSIYITAFFFIFVLACSTTKNAVQKTGTSQSVAQPQAKIKTTGAGRLYDSISGNYLAYNILSVKFNVELQLSGENHSLDGVFRIKKDSMIWISFLAPLGIEMARLLFTPDSIYFLNKLKNEYFVKSYSFFEDNYQVEFSFNNLQSILTHQIFLYSENDEDYNMAMNSNMMERDFIRKTFFTGKDSAFHILKTHRKHRIKKYQRKNVPGVMVETIKILPNIYKIQSVEVAEYAEKKKLAITYNHFEPINHTLFPKSVAISVSDSLNSYHLDLTFNKITVNPNVSFSFNIPSSYKKLP